MDITPEKLPQLKFGSEDPGSSRAGATEGSPSSSKFNFRPQWTTRRPTISGSTRSISHNSPVFSIKSFGSTVTKASSLTTGSLDHSYTGGNPTTISQNSKCSGSEGSGTSENSDEIWLEAYRRLKKKDQELVQVYETILARQEPEDRSKIATSPKIELQDSERISRMRSLVSDILASRESYHKLHEASDTIFGATLISKDIIDRMIYQWPSAAITWSTICTILLLAAKPLENNSGLVNGFKHLIDQIHWYMVAIPTFLTSHNDSRDISAIDWISLKEDTIALYQCILEYQMQSLCYCYNSHPIVTALKTVFKLGEWITQLLDEILSQEMVIDQVISRVTHGETLRKAWEPFQNKHGIPQEIHSKHKQGEEITTTPKPKFQRDQMKELPRQAAETLQWFRECSEFKKWIDGPSNFLLLSADPWCGKSVLARYLVDEVLPRKLKATICCSFFEVSGDSHDKKEETMFVLSTMSDELASKVLVPEDHVEKGTRMISNKQISDVADIFIRASEIEAPGDIFCVLDALDQCDLGFLSMFLKICFTKPQGKRTVKFLATTRPNHEILHLFKYFGPRYTHVSWSSKTFKANLQRDIVTVVDKKLSTLNIRGGYDRIRKALGLEERYQSSYFWAEIVLGVLKELPCGSFEAKQWRRVMDSSLQERVPVFEKLLEPATTGKQQTLKSRYEVENHPSYPTVRRLLLGHLQSLLGAPAKLRRGKFEWEKEPSELFPGSAWSDDGPSLAVIESTLFVVWRGICGDQSLWWTSKDLKDAKGPDEGWTPPEKIRDATTTSRPSITAFRNTIIAMWKGPNEDEGLYFSLFNRARIQWSKISRTSFGSKAGPAVAFWKTNSGDRERFRVWAAWRGVAGDDNLFWRASFDGSKWDDQYPNYIDLTTDSRPALASCHGRLYLAWTSSALDTSQQIWISFLEEDKEFWEKPFCVETHCHSSTAPTLAEFNGRMYVAWRGKGNDTGIWLTSCDRPGGEDHLERPQRLERVATNCTPAMVEWDGKLVFVWKGGINNDYKLWWGYGDFNLSKT